MGRYIDEAYLLATIKKEYFRLKYIRETIANTPGIEIVRCRECRHYYNKDPEHIPTASIICGHMHPDDFCSYGERKDDE